MQESLGFFVRQVLTAQEDERNRIALELHDDTTQELLVICQRLDRLAGRDAPGGRGVPAELESCAARDPDADRPAALSRDCVRASSTTTARRRAGWLGDQIDDEYGTIQVETEAACRLAQHAAAALSRRAEAMRNVARHAGPAVVSVRTDGHLR
jgi:signal transduction histidine kinase